MKKTKRSQILFVAIYLFMLLGGFLATYNFVEEIEELYKAWPEAEPTHKLFRVWLIITVSIAALSILAFLIFLATVLEPTVITFRSALTVGWANIAAAIECFIAWIAFGVLSKLMDMGLILAMVAVVGFLITTGCVALNYAQRIKQEIQDR